MKIVLPTFAMICMIVSGSAWSADIASCVACHNDKMVANPILDGQHAKYIEKQLLDLKKDLRVHAQMQGIAKTLDDKQIADLSKAFASKKWANPNPKEPRRSRGREKSGPEGKLHSLSRFGVRGYVQHPKIGRAKV